MRMMVVFEKSYPVRHIGHLDLMRTMQRALRRSGLPVRYSQGFNPHIKLSFASPLSVGIVGEREIMDVPDGGRSTTPTCLWPRLNRAMPEQAERGPSPRAIDDQFPDPDGSCGRQPLPYRDGRKCRTGLQDAVETACWRRTNTMAPAQNQIRKAMCDIRPYIEHAGNSKRRAFLSRR